MAQSRLRGAEGRDALVLFVTGHGRRTMAGTHQMVMPAGDPQLPEGDNYPTATLLAKALTSGASQVLIIVNVCYAGTLSQTAREIAQTLPARRGQGAALAVIATVDERPRDREFATLLTGVHKQPRGTAESAGPLLSLDEFLTELTRAAHQDPDVLLPVPLRTCETWRTREPMACLPTRATVHRRRSPRRPGSHSQKTLPHWTSGWFGPAGARPEIPAGTSPAART